MIQVEMELDHHDYMKVLRLVEHLTSVLGPRGLNQFTLQEVRPYLVKQHSERFAQEKDPRGAPWIRLAEATERLRAYHGFAPAHPINERTGQLKNYVLSSYDLTVKQLPGRSAALAMKMPGIHTRAQPIPGVTRKFARQMAKKRGGNPKYLQTKLKAAQQGGQVRQANKWRPGQGGYRPFPARPIVGYGPNDQMVITMMAARWFGSMMEGFRG